jgi:YSIRK-targeted surface antigen transcriptional regulator
MYLFQLSGLIKSENVRYGCELVYELLEVPICFLNRDGDISFEFSHEQASNPAAPGRKELYGQLLQHNQDDSFPIFTTTPYMEVYFTIRVIREGTLIGTVIVGPALPDEMDEEAIQALFKDHEIPVKKKAEWVGYYQSLPVTGYKKLISTSLLLYYYIYGTKLDSAEVMEKNALLEKVNQKIESTIDAELMKNRQHAIYHHTQAYEKILLQYVKEGNKEKLLDHLNKPTEGETGKLSKNPLRNQKNLFICSTTLISRAAIEGGLSSELAFTISDSYIQRVEEMNNVSEVMNLQYKMLGDFTERVHRVKEHNYSKTIIKCQNYIFQHLYEDITLAQLAELSGISSNYLSELFKKEVGIPVIEYIQKERIEEARKLLVLTDASIMDVCVSMNFSDQSYFTKIFRKFTGVTPKQYRDANSGS